MAKLLCINSLTYRVGVNNIGDVVGVFPDNQPFTPKEYEQFDIVDVSGTVEEVTANLPKFETKQAIEVTAEKGTFQELTPDKVKTLWKNGADWQVLEVRPKYAYTVDNGDVKLVAPTLADNVKTTVSLAEIVKEDTIATEKSVG